MSIRLLANRVAVRPEPVANVSEGGIHLGNSAEKPLRGDVVYVGPGYYAPNGTFVETIVQPGDKVVYTKGAGENLEVDGEQLLILGEHQIVGILT